MKKSKRVYSRVNGGKRTPLWGPENAKVSDTLEGVQNMVRKNKKESQFCYQKIMQNRYIFQDGGQLFLWR